TTYLSALVCDKGNRYEVPNSLTEKAEVNCQLFGVNVEVDTILEFCTCLYTCKLLRASCFHNLSRAERLLARLLHSSYELECTQTLSLTEAFAIFRSSRPNLCPSMKISGIIEKQYPSSIAQTEHQQATVSVYSRGPGIVQGRV
ncbi:unnamed protein product, partial [Ectocarpus sp. 12 AP-2014]